MGFVFGLVVGLVVGLGIIVGFVRSENARSKLRSELATTIAAFARMTVEDSKKILPAEFYPSWVVFSHRQKLTWLNHHLEKLWPYVNEAASELIKSSVEPVLEQYRPFILSSLKFSKFTLGTVAPQFTGVSIIEDGGSGVTMELEMQWDANSSIILAIKTRLGVALPVQVKNIGFTGVFRLIFRPLVDEFPGFAAVSYSLREKKKLDFTLKVVGGDISTIPGLSDSIEATIHDAIEDSITWPVRKIVPILPGDYSELELKPVGTLEVKLVQAKGLTNKDLIGKSDPYAVLFVRPLPEKTKKSKTIVHLELLYCPFGMENVFTNPFAPNFSMTSLEKVLTNGEKALKSGANGTEAIELEKDASQKRREVIIRGVLSVTVILAENLPASDLMGKADPYVVLTMKKSETRNKTRVVNDCLNPIWNQTFDFVVEDGLHDMLIAEVWDHDTFGKDYMGRCILTLTRVILEGEYTDCFELDGTKSGKLKLHLKWMPQPIYRDT
ncbi:synaptotagmin-4 isoform X2 [Citrus sinensis]|uniref:synaptotagmin-4 isoform X3 n=1 Tax=Citrus clementina TaxID=85681 RepID=UPI000CED0269|nr:synaptotagmin-4 isoform X3 [Citrus x clementina]XP_052289300.1 synaptotagmin-4 isoform X2 [Citrus sinensis]